MHTCNIEEDIENIENISSFTDPGVRDVEGSFPSEMVEDMQLHLAAKELAIASVNISAWLLLNESATALRESILDFPFRGDLAKMKRLEEVAGSSDEIRKKSSLGESCALHLLLAYFLS